MTNAENLRFHRGDILAVLLVAALAVFVAFCFLPRQNGEAVMAEIYQSGELVKTLPLNEDTTFQITDRYANTITVRDGKISITESDCPGEDCVHSGAIHTAGRSIVCLPNAVEVRVVSSASDVDFVVG